MIKAILFDWGGVLAPSDNKIAAIRLEKNYLVNAQEFNKVISKHEDELSHTKEYHSFLQIIAQQFDIPEQAIINALNSAEPDEVYELAKKLAQQEMRVSILSNQLIYRAEYIKKHFDLSFFEEIFFSCEVGLKKPDPKIFRHVLKTLNLEAHECLFIDDTEENIFVAQKMGFQTIHFKNVPELIRELEKKGINE